MCYNCDTILILTYPGGEKMGNTTSMLIEHIINGFHFLLAIILFIFMILGFTGWDLINFITFLPQTKVNINISITTIVLFIPLVYTLGILVDNFVDNVVLKKRGKSIRNKVLKDGQSGRELIFRTKDDNQAKQLDYIQTKIRITRTAAFNFALITVFLVLASVLHLRFQLSIPKLTLLIVVEFVIGTGLSYMAYWSWKQNVTAFCKRVKSGFEILNKQ